MHIALAGGVGGAKLALGLARVLKPEDLLVVVNTGDDFTHFDLKICPDLDTVMYTLAGIANPETGWGIRNETWSFMNRIEQEGGPVWFRLGDKDLETHRARTSALATGQSLTDVTAQLAHKLGVRHRIAPATDNRVRTIVVSGKHRHRFQDYFVRLACTPRVDGFVYEGADDAVPAPPVMEAAADGSIESVILCPSNPFVSIGPILAIPGFRRLLETRSFPALAVSPIIGGKAVKGPAAKMMGELGVPVNSLTIAQHYAPFIDGLIVDKADSDQADAIRALDMKALVTGTLMQTDNDKIRLAEQVLNFADKG